MIRKKLKDFTPVALLFILLNAFFISGRTMLHRWGADQEVLIIGNLLLFLITALSFFMASRGLSNSNPQVFIRAVYGGIMLKFFVCIIAALIYISMYKKDLNKPALFGCMGLYLVYTFLEVYVLTKKMKQKSHG
jgi:hypothetical protein